jgi:hypothetical protein
MENMLYLAAFLTVVTGIAHSYLGERYILAKLFRRDDLPTLSGSARYTARVLRLAWHVTTLAWLGLAAVLVLLARPAVTPQAIGLAIGATFLAHFVIALVGSRGKHLSWPLFLAIGVLAIWATQNA